VKRAVLVPLAGALLLLVGLRGVGAETYRLAWSYQTGGEVSSVSISSDGSYIAAASGRWVYLFSRSTGTPLWSYWTGGRVESVSISSDGSYIAAGSQDGKVYLSVQLTGTPGRGLLPLILILVVVGAAVAGTVAWRRGLLRRPAGARPPGEPKGPFCPHCKLRLPRRPVLPRVR